MARTTFNVRFSEEELRTIRIAARARGWPVGRYIRFRALGTDRDQETRIEQLEKKVRTIKSEGRV